MQRSNRHTANSKTAAIAFIGTAGVPNRYGGFEGFLENCSPAMTSHVSRVYITCDKSIHHDTADIAPEITRIFISIPANGAYSIVHDLIAFIKVFPLANTIFVLGVSGGIWFPVFRLLCTLFSKKLIVNIDGLEWRRPKFSWAIRKVLKLSDFLAQTFAHKVIYDNPGLEKFIIRNAIKKAICIPYSGDHIKRLENVVVERSSALSVCRIEPENNIEILVAGFQKSCLSKYTIIGNWEHSAYSQALRNKCLGFEGLVLLDPVYDPITISEHRERCEFYLHGHSVGGTNPSLVEMLFYRKKILCYDVIFNRETAGNLVKYFYSAESLKNEINQFHVKIDIKDASLQRYSRKLIAKQYTDLCSSE